MKKTSFFMFAAFALLAVTGCAGTDKSSQQRRPDWVSTPASGCSGDEICALGSGTTSNLAKADAQSEMMKIFENQIKASFKNTLSSSDTQVAEMTSDEVQSMTDGILKGVKIRERYDDASGYYALAVLNRKEAANNLRTEIESIDEKMLVLVRDDAPASATKLQKLYAYREGLNLRYAFLNQGHGMMQEVTYDQVFQQKKKKSSGKIVSLDIKEPKNRQIGSEIKKLLQDEGYKVATAGYNVVIEGELVAEELTINVPGFVKFSYTLALDTKTTGGSELGTLSVTVTETGRDQTQAYRKAVDQITSYIKENFADLGI